MDPTSHHDSGSPSLNLHLKEEVFDLDFAESNLQKKRRNRSTMSCLNCHASKRKCDRKRPCSRCIQLGLTGLCIYETADPNERDDPNLPEVERLRARVAELESLVRELRGKPHPQWVVKGMRDGEGGAVRNTRPSKSLHNGLPRHDAANGDGLYSPQGTMPKGDLLRDPSRATAYGFSPPESPSGVYRSAYGANDTLSYFDDQRSYRTNGSTPLSYSPVSPSVSSGYSGETCSADYSPRSPSAAGFGFNNGTPPSATTQDGRLQEFDRMGYHMPGPLPSCPCLTNPAVAHTYIALSHQLQSTHSIVSRLPEHGPQTSCGLMKRLADLNGVIHGNYLTNDAARSSYELAQVTSSGIASPAPQPSATDYAAQSWQMASGGFQPPRAAYPGHQMDNTFSKALSYHVGA